MPYSVVTEQALLDLAHAASKVPPDERLERALNAVEAKGFTFVGVGSSEGETCYIFHSAEVKKRLSNIR